MLMRQRPQHHNSSRDSNQDESRLKSKSDLVAREEGKQPILALDVFSGSTRQALQNQRGNPWRGERLVARYHGRGRVSGARYQSGQEVTEGLREVKRG